jgi:hypothetical protein
MHPRGRSRSPVKRAQSVRCAASLCSEDRGSEAQQSNQKHGQCISRIVPPLFSFVQHAPLDTAHAFASGLCASSHFLSPRAKHLTGAHPVSFLVCDAWLSLERSSLVLCTAVSTSTHPTRQDMAWACVIATLLLLCAAPARVVHAAQITSEGGNISLIVDVGALTFLCHCLCLLSAHLLCP